MYIKINGKTKKYNVSVVSFTTQHNNKAIRFIGEEVPTTDKGFKYFNDDDTEILDLSAYTYQYRQNEYTTVEDIIVLPGGNEKPLDPSPFDRMNSRISQLSNQVSSITPYTESKTAYIDDTEVIFKGVKDGNISVYMIDGDGKSVPFDFEKVMGDVKVTFDKRTSLATVTISIQ